MTTFIRFLGCVLDALKPPSCPLCGRKVPGFARLGHHLRDAHQQVLA